MVVGDEWRFRVFETETETEIETRPETATMAIAIAKASYRICIYLHTIEYLRDTRLIRDDCRHCSCACGAFY